MSEYVPTTEEVRSGYSWSTGGVEHTQTDEGDAEFDRWLDKHDAEVAAKAWDEGHDAGWNSRDDDAARGWMPSGVHESDAVNPYRKAVKS